MVVLLDKFLMLDSIEGAGPTYAELVSTPKNL
jgi:hypothetical protein